MNDNEAINSDEAMTSNEAAEKYIYNKKWVKAASFSNTNDSEYTNLTSSTSKSELLNLAMNPNSIKRALAASKQINDRQEPGTNALDPINFWVLGQEELLAIRNKSSSDRIFSVNLMLAVFTNEELTQPNVNVFGGVSKGNESNKENYIPLDVQRIDTLKQTVLGYVKGDQKIKNAVWKSCKDAMNIKMSQLKRAKRDRDSLRETLLKELNIINNNTNSSSNNESNNNNNESNNNNNE
jgi:hypothetical protein